mmetsp:Transcript_18487/g.25436  ORF Transcript_18487/g.25436 Transcript_18487/m.25436 type:complete len:245 (-) Transcript_18487:275-1009(-)
MSASKVLPDHHMLDCLTRSSHVHGVRKVFPPGAVILSFLLKDHIGLVSDISWDIISLCRTASGVNKDDTVLSNKGIIKSTGEEFVVRTVDGVPALEGNNILVIGKCFTDLGRCPAFKVTDWFVKTSDFSTHVVLSTLGGNHKSTWMLDCGGTVAFEALKRLIGGVFICEFNCGNGEVTILKKDGHTGLKVLRVGIKDNRKTKDKSTGKLNILNNVIVGCFVHESSEGRESAVGNKLNIAKLTGS